MPSSVARSSATEPEPESAPAEKHSDSPWSTGHRFADGTKPENLFTGHRQNRPSVLDDCPPPGNLTQPEQLQLKTIRTHGPELDALTRHVRQDDPPSLDTLPLGIDRDLERRQRRIDPALELGRG